MKDRIYVCHTYYHAYIAALKELNIDRAERGSATLILSTMSNDFGNLKQRAEKCGLFEEVHMFEEKEDVFFPPRHDKREHLLFYCMDNGGGIFAP